MIDIFDFDCVLKFRWNAVLKNFFRQVDRFTTTKFHFYKILFHLAKRSVLWLLSFSSVMIMFALMTQNSYKAIVVKTLLDESEACPNEILFRSDMGVIGEVKKELWGKDAWLYRHCEEGCSIQLLHTGSLFPSLRGAARLRAWGDEAISKRQTVMITLIA